MISSDKTALSIRDHPKALCVVTHHKTGTVWMRSVFSAIAGAFGIPFASAQDPASAVSIAKQLDTGPAILVVLNGVIPRLLADDPDIRFIHMIRDPRDVLLSGLQYHLSHVPRRNSPETSIHAPRSEFGGLTYQQKLRSIPTNDARLRFEMIRRHNTTVRQMLNWDYSDPRTTEWRYEDMMLDRDCARFASAMQAIGYRPDKCKTMCRTFLEKSIFDQTGQSVGADEHVKSGCIRRWETELPATFKTRYEEKYGYALRALGYETDGGWAERAKPSM